MSKLRIITRFIQQELLKESDDVILAADDDLMDRSPIDSLGVVNLVAFLESEFSVKIRPGEVTLKNFRTIGAMLALVERKLAEA